MVSQNPSDIELHVRAQNGTVFIDGPGGVIVSLTAEAAIATSDRLLDAAMTAAGQRGLDRRAAKRD